MMEFNPGILEGLLARTSEEDVSSLLSLPALPPMPSVKGDALFLAGIARNEDLRLRITAAMKLQLLGSKVMQTGNEAEAELGSHDAVTELDEATSEAQLPMGPSVMS